jgi:hypothetical protein
VCHPTVCRFTRLPGDSSSTVHPSGARRLNAPERQVTARRNALRCATNERDFAAFDGWHHTASSATRFNSVERRILPRVVRSLSTCSHWRRTDRTHAERSSPLRCGTTGTHRILRATSNKDRLLGTVGLHVCWACSCSAPPVDPPSTPRLPQGFDSRSFAAAGGSGDSCAREVQGNHRSNVRTAGSHGRAALLRVASSHVG